ncbi:MBL fold metallo-hydrolase [Actinoplanes sp. NPDC051861]|uniref:MBL fold metallo-hydrolase n=1 Tax=Actinoplanes sp. NPDC051861 TaxID=3155170 RepID=UPI0034123DE3
MIHHLNCGTLRPPGTPGGLVCHVLLVETPGGLVLVDSGYGLRDAADPWRRVGMARLLIRPALDPAEAAINQIRALGQKPEDVRDIVLTHFDGDHAGGLADFPWARVHVTSAEASAVTAPRTFTERYRYLAAVRSHGPDLVTHDPGRGDWWRGFAAATEILPGVVLVGLPGHTRGHAAVAVSAGSRWVLHAGDAFYHRGEVDGTGSAPKALVRSEMMIAHSRPRVAGNHERLRELWTAGHPDLMIVNAHDPELLRRARESVGGAC